MNIRRLEVTGANILFGGTTLQLQWSPIMVFTLKRYHELNLFDEMTVIILTYLDQQFSLTDEERQQATTDLTSLFSSF